MNKENRIKTISTSPENGERKTINYKGNNILPVQEIPLTALLYNPYNGRIRSSILSYEQRANRLVNPEDDKDKLIIEQYLYDSASHKNEKTIESLEINGQQEVGIITKDGVIIDGNRRALLLNLINRKNNTSIPFKAIVLPDELQNHEKDIILLETGYQMGVDSKVDYNAIEKYIRCFELKTTHSLTSEDIAKIMAEEPKKINEWLGILNLMDEYLTRLSSPKVYTRLEKREGHFVDLYNYLKTYGNLNSQSVKWAYTADDLTKMKHSYFDYIRLGIPVQRARIIGKPSSSNSFFCQKSIWKEYIVEHEKIIQSYSEQSFNSLKEVEVDKSYEDIIRLLDVKWKENLETQLSENISYSESSLKDFIELHTPLKLLKRVQNNLNQIDSNEIKNSPKEETLKLLTVISSKVTSLLNSVTES